MADAQRNSGADPQWGGAGHGRDSGGRQEPRPRTKGSSPLIAYALAAGIFALDRTTKVIIEARVSFEDSFNVIPGFFQIVHSENRGMAFGVLDESGWLWRALLIAFSLTAIGVIATLLKKSRERIDPWTFYGLTLIMGGAAGNVYDRIVTGRVTDFLLFYVRSYQWPAFNVADSAITIGAGLVLIEMLRPKRQAANVP